MKRVGLHMLLLSICLGSSAKADIQSEISGIEPQNKNNGPYLTQPKVLASIPAGGVLLIPESTNDRVMAFDPVTGDLIDPNFIPSDSTNLSTPIEALIHPDGQRVLVSDQLDDVVQQYDLQGNYLGVFAPAGGVDTSILDNVRGMAISDRNTLLVSVGGGANDDAIAEFDLDGNYIANFIANGAGGMDSPFDVTLRGADYLVPAITSDAIHSFDLSGSANPNVAAVDTFPEQVFVTNSGNILIGNFSGLQEGVVELTSAGGLVGIYDPASLGGYRGVYELANGNILTTNGAGVHEIDRSGNLVETKISGVSARFISLAGQGLDTRPVPVFGAFGLLLLSILFGVVVRQRLRD